MGWYNSDRAMSYNALFTFVLGGRGYGKTFHFKEKAIKNFIKKGKQFVYLRRYKDEFLDISQFWDDMMEHYPHLEFEVKGKKAYIDGKIAGYFVPLSTSQRKKSVPYPRVNLIIFDEFIIDKGNIRYISNEVEMFLEFFETVARKRDDVRAVFLGNNVSLVNPYFSYFKSIPVNQERFTIRRDGEVLVELAKDADFVIEKKNTKFGKLIEGTKYGDYAIDNKALRDSNAFIQKYKPQDSIFVFSVIFNRIEVGFHSSSKEGIFYCNREIQKTSRNRFSITKDDHDTNYLMYDKLSKFFVFKQFIKLFQLGSVRFKDIEIKNDVYAIMQYMNIK